MKKKLLSLLTALCLCLTLLPTVALAADTTTATDETTLKAAVTSDGTVTLGADITLTSPLTITGTVTLDLNGHTLSGAAGSSAPSTYVGTGGNGSTAITVSGGTLTIKDTSTGSIVGGNGGNGNHGSNGGNGGTAITVKDGGSLTVSGGEIVGGNGGAGGNGGDGGSATINSGTINGGNGGEGGAGGAGLSVTGGTVTITGSGTINGGTAGTGGSDTTGSTSGAPGTPGKAIACSGEGSIGVSSEDMLKKALELGLTSIQLADDITLTSPLTITGTVTLDLNGRVLKYENSGTQGSVIKITESSGNLTLKDSRANDTTAKHYFTVDESTGLWSLCTTDGCKHSNCKTVTGGVITGGTGTAQTEDGITTHIGGGVYNDGTFNMTGGTITGCMAYGNSGISNLGSEGGGVYMESGTFTMSGNASISGCTAIQKATTSEDGGNGGGVYVNGVYVSGNCFFTMHSGTIKNCTRSNDNGGGVYVKETCSFTMNGGSITGNSASNGSDVFLNSNGTMYANGGEVGNISSIGTITRNASGTAASTYTTFGTVSGIGTIDEKAKLTVTFNSNYEGSTNTTQKVLKGQKVAEPTAPTNGTYVFDGWYTAASGGTKFDFAKPVTASVTLYAVWQVNSYAVAFDSNGGSAVDAQTVSHGAAAAKPSDPGRKGYLFDGWYLNGEKYDFTAPSPAPSPSWPAGPPW